MGPLTPPHTHSYTHTNTHQDLLYNMDQKQKPGLCQRTGSGASGSSANSLTSLECSACLSVASKHYLSCGGHLEHYSTFCQLCAVATQMASPGQVQTLVCSSQPWGSPLLCLSTRLGAASFWWPVFLIPDFSWWAVLVWVCVGGGGMQVLCIQGEEYKLGYHFSATIHLHFSSREGFSLTWNLQCRQHCLGRKSERSTYLCLPALG